jgi:carboxymethylenebutenolidase
MSTAMVEDDLQIRTSDGMPDGVIVAPGREGRWPGVLMLTDIFGIRAAHRVMARRLAGEGYTVCMPNLFYRTSRPPVFDFTPNHAEERTRARIAELRAPLTPEAIERDALAYVDFLAAHATVAAGPLGVVGYCAAGSIAIRIAAARPDAIAAAASFHGGGLVTDTPASPHLLLPRIKARLYFGHAVQDRSMPAEAIEKLEGALREWGGAFESETYDGAFHGWTVPDNAAYNEPQADRAFARLVALFASTLKQPATRAHA